MKAKLILTAFILSLTCYTLHAQDLIYKKNKEVITVKIIEVGVDEIKYKEFNNQTGPSFAIDKNEITHIKFESGRTQYFGDKVSDPNLYADNKKNAIKIDFLSPLFGQTTLAYERSLKPGASMEFQLGIIGLGVNNYTAISPGTSCSGGFIRAGYKFITSPDFYVKGMRYAHILKGAYVKPEITVGQCSETFPGSSNPFTGMRNNVTQSASLAAIMIDFGKQWVMNDIFIVDYFVGFGYGYKSNNPQSINSINIDQSTYIFNSHAFLGPYAGFPLAWTGGLKVGILIK